MTTDQNGVFEPLTKCKRSGSLSYILHPVTRIEFTMAECAQQRSQCQALLRQLKESQALLKNQFLNDGSSLASQSLGLSFPVSSAATMTANLVKPQTGILKTSMSVPRSRSADKVLEFDMNNSASPVNSIKAKASSKVLPQGFSDYSTFQDTFSDGNSMDTSDTMSRNARFPEVTGRDQMHENLEDSRTGIKFSTSNSEVTSKHTNTATFGRSSTSLPSASPSKQTWRQILNKHVTVPSQLSTQELRDLDSVHGLNFSYSCENENAGAESKLNVHSLSRNSGEIGKTTVCKDITNRPVSMSISDMATAKTAPGKSKDKETAAVKALNPDNERDIKKVKFFREQLEDDGNNRKLNNFIRDTSIKPKSLLNSTSYRSLSSSKHDTSGTSLEMTAEDQRLLGYDWIAALLDNDPGLVNQSESFFNELKDFRRAYKSECSNQFYKESPHNLVEFEAEPVAEALKETKVHPYIVNERLFTQPFKSGLIDYGDDDKVKRDNEIEKKEPSEENPRFVRVSIPRSTLSTPYKVKPHRRRSFDGSDSCALMDHCLLGWENTRPAMIPTAKSLDLNTEAGTRVDSQVTTLSEAERLAAKFSHAEWPFSRPTPRCTTLPSWRKHYMDTTLNLSRISSSNDVGNVSGSNVTSGSGRLPQDVKRSTDAILRATYSTMYEMERLRKERELEMARGKDGNN
ncbi:migration and invasion-inhibitory protein [Plakobranchus ocellatus]|uniref:Migration and invasion-inhibitory protein n=1 Tax=Plakobranchus ocellatus TaxID=259542 RepID=A0AAV4BSU8_9GAST|nr:migration and invasion-inhibitory protein [Plakobranchus ocellatus]